ncbi:hypothetical protein H2509_20555 [Stappia sp. F7233]|uniref:Uncharacterized protein n=1 Tax=Stappia albiluteola TaxID=2758565 RepID=A0A839AM78_9HYPH|nr:hypothetical protein [Stappia albiluteola]MBA5779529.1 hypothetical protein [Stappia albiluteola]
MTFEGDEEPAGEAPVATVSCVLLAPVDGLGQRGAVVTLDLDRAADLETAGAARRASLRDLQIAGTQGAS